MVNEYMVEIFLGMEKSKHGEEFSKDISEAVPYPPLVCKYDVSQISGHDYVFVHSIYYS